MNSRRSFIKKSSLITLGALNYNFSPLVKDINGIDISVVTYSFNPGIEDMNIICLLYTSPSPRDGLLSRMPSSA